MKNIILAFLAFCGVMLMAAAGSENYATSASTYTRSWAVDTITNTEVDTLIVGGGSTPGVNFQSNFEGGVGVVIANLSGTSSLTIVVDEGFVDATGTVRYDNGQDTITTTAAAGTTFVDIGRLAGTRYRIRITGAGTQSTTYRLTFIAKPTA